MWFLKHCNITEAALPVVMFVHATAPSPDLAVSLECQSMEVTTGDHLDDTILQGFHNVTDLAILVGTG